MRLILDTNILVSASLFRKSMPGRAVREATLNHTFLFSGATFLELQQTLDRPKFDRLLLPDDKNEFISKIEKNGIFISPTENITACRDPKDNKFLELALSGNADLIISGDKDLLVLNPFRGIPIITATEFLDKY